MKPWILENVHKGGIVYCGRVIAQRKDSEGLGATRDRIGTVLEATLGEPKNPKTNSNDNIQKYVLLIDQLISLLLLILNLLPRVSYYRGWVPTVGRPIIG